MFEDENKNNNDRVKQMPLYKKAWEIMTLCDKISESVTSQNSDDLEDFKRDILTQYSRYIRANAMLIPAKISGAEAVEIYDLKMENASLIRKAAREIITDCSGLKISGYKEVDYLEMLRDEIDEFRVLFAEWVKTFDPWNYNIDRWGLFNPPGIDYDTHDPDDDIPFNPNNF